MNQSLNQSQIVEIIITTINKIFSNIFSSINNSMFSKLDEFAFVDVRILNNKYIKNYLFNGCITDSNCFIFYNKVFFLSVFRSSD